MLGIEKIQENWFTPNFKNYVHQQKKAPNKSTEFVINQNLFPLVRMKDSLKNAISLDRKAASIRISIWKKLKKTVSSSRNKIFLNIELPLIATMVSKKTWMKEYRFH